MRLPVAAQLAAEPADDESLRWDAWLVAPRAAAAAVMGMLGFGVVVGSLVGASAANPLSQLIVAVKPSTHHVLTSPSLAAGGASGGGGGGGTITITTPAPASPSPAPTPVVATTTSTGTTTTPRHTNGPPVNHVFLIMLSNEGYNQTFGHTANDPYLAKALVKQGELLVNYYAVAGSPLANEIALVSGQGPNAETAMDCPKYDPFIASGLGTQGQLLGSGCVFPPSASSLADELTAAQLTWKAYLETTGSGKRARAEACRRGIGASTGATPTASQPYAVWRNPFLFFSSLTSTKCPKTNVPLGRLATDLKKASTTPAFSYIVADACHDGSDVPCGPNKPAGMGPADAFLKKVIPEIKRSPAYRAGGLIAITFDNAPQTGPQADSSSCCGNPTYPNMLGVATTPTTTTPAGTTPTTTTPADATPTTTTPAGTTPTTTTTTDTTTTPSPTTTTPSPTTSTTPALGAGEISPTGGGGQVGLLLLSKYVKPNVPEVTDYFNHFSLLASIEELFGLKRLGYAAVHLLPVFGSAVYDNAHG